MTEEKQEHEEQHVAPNFVNIVKSLVSARKLAEFADSYTDGGPKSQPLVISDGAATNDQTLYRFIKNAEKEFIKANQQEIIRHAGALIQDELDYIREVLK